MECDYVKKEDEASFIDSLYKMNHEVIDIVDYDNECVVVIHDEVIEGQEDAVRW